MSFTELAQSAKRKHDQIEEEQFDDEDMDDDAFDADAGLFHPVLP